MQGRLECPVHGPGDTFTTDSPTVREFCSRCYPRYVPMVRVVPCDDAAMTRAVNAALAEMLRLLAADDFDDEREGDESPERFVARKAMEAGFRAAGETP